MFKDTLTKLTWTPLTKISLILIDNKFLISNSLIKKKILIGKSELISLMLGTARDELIERLQELEFINKENLLTNENLKNGLKEWEKKGWSDCLCFYLSSRDIKYFDINDSVKNKGCREKALREFSKKGLPINNDNFDYNIKLPNPRSLKADKTLGHLLTKRTSVRRYKETLNINEISDLLWYGLLEVRVNRKTPNEITDYLKSYGCAFEIYLCIYKIEGLEQGIYKYNLVEHSLALIEKGDFRKKMLDIHMGQNVFDDASITVLYKVNFNLYQWRYRHERALRNLYIESGRLMQKMIITAENLEAGSFITPALKDHKLSKMLKLDSVNEVVIYSQTLGRKFKREEE